MRARKEACANGPGDRPGIGGSDLARRQSPRLDRQRNKQQPQCPFTVDVHPYGGAHATAPPSLQRRANAAVAVEIVVASPVASRRLGGGPFSTGGLLSQLALTEARDPPVQQHPGTDGLQEEDAVTERNGTAGTGASIGTGAGRRREKKKGRRKAGVRKERKTISTKARKALVRQALKEQQVQQQQQQVQQQEQDETTAEAPPGSPPAPPPAPDHPAAVRNHGLAWNKADLTALAKLVADPAYLRATIPSHPEGSEVDWELLSRHFGRYSRGGTAVRQQHLALSRLAREARQEGRTGVNYAELVIKALRRLPEGSGTVHDVQRVLKESAELARHLDKYKSNGTKRWKAAVGVS
jgi:hypothetical protein